jgi:hypothetical protein
MIIMKTLDTHRRKIMALAAAVLAIGVALAEQPTSDQGMPNTEKLQRITPWVPGANMLMSAHESNIGPLTPPR